MGVGFENARQNLAQLDDVPNLVQLGQRRSAGAHSSLKLLTVSRYSAPKSIEARRAHPTAGHTPVAWLHTMWPARLLLLPGQAVPAGSRNIARHVS